PDAAAVVLSARIEARLDPGERGRLAHQSGGVGDPLERDLARLPHLGEQPQDRSRIFKLLFGGGASDGERVEDLADRLRVVRLQNVLDRIADGCDRRLGPAGASRFYVLRYIKSGRWLDAVAIAHDAGLDCVIHASFLFNLLPGARVDRGPA